MKYILKEDFANKSVLIEDVKVADEPLYKDDGIRYGGKVSCKESLKTLKQRIIDAIDKGKITNLEKRGLCYRFEWLAIEDGKVTVDDAEVLYSLIDAEIVNLLDECIKYFAVKSASAQEKAMERVLREGRASDDFAWAAGIFAEYSNGGVIPQNWGKKNAEYFLKLVGRYEHLFLHTPYGEDAHKNGYKTPNHLVSWVGTSVVAVAAIASGIAGIVSSFNLGAILCPVLGCINVVMTRILLLEHNNERHEVERRVFWDTIGCVEGEYDLEYSVPFPKTKVRRKGLVTFGEKTLNYVQEKGCFEGAEEQISFLKALLGHYTEDKIGECFYGEKGPDRHQYMKSLLAFERAIYAKNTKIGFMKGRPNITVDDLTDRLVYLGCSQEDIYIDPIYMNIRKAIDSISIMPYEGCDLELIDLIRLAVEYHNDIEKGNDGSARYYEVMIEHILLSSQYRRENVRRLERQAEECLAREAALQGSSVKQSIGGKNMSLLPTKEGDAQI